LYKPTAMLVSKLLTNLLVLGCPNLVDVASKQFPNLKVLLEPVRVDYPVDTVYAFSDNDSFLI
jgi:hypothetical protein